MRVMRDVGIEDGWKKESEIGAGRFNVLSPAVR